MNYKDNIEWLKSLKQQIGQSQHRDLWHFEQVIDETIENLKPLAKPHGRLIDAEKLAVKIWTEGHFVTGNDCEIAVDFTQSAPTIIEAEVSE